MSYSKEDSQLSKSKELGDGGQMQYINTCKIKLNNSFLIAETIQGYENAWIIGDEHLAKAAGHLLGERGSSDQTDTLFMKRNYNVKPYMKIHSVYKGVWQQDCAVH